MSGCRASGAALGAAAGSASWANSFSHNMERDQLGAQQIFFPAADSKALPAAEFPDLQQYGGQQVVNGDQAKAYADGFIGRHLQAIGNGQTYSQVSAASLANPTDPKLAAQVQTLFRGETLRGLLLNAYGWWQIGQYALRRGRTGDRSRRGVPGLPLRTPRMAGGGATRAPRSVSGGPGKAASSGPLTVRHRQLPIRSRVDPPATRQAGRRMA